MNETTNILHTALTELSPLSDSERLDAKDKAREIVLRSYGEKPSKDKFVADDISEYPAWLNRVVLSLLIVVGFSAFATSFFRLFTIGRDNFLLTINDHWQGVVVGVAVVLMAEFLTLVSGLSREVLLPAGRRWLMFVPMLLGVVIALVGNWTVAQPHDVFSFLEAVAPPVVVLIVSMLGERLLITTIKARHALRKQYQQALNDWKQATADPENSAQWRPAYANALREMIVTVNSKGTGSTRRKELIATLDRRAWVALVNREMQSDTWFTPLPDVAHDQQQHGQPETVYSSPTGAPAVNPTLASPAPMTATTIQPAPVMHPTTYSQNGHSSKNGHSA